MPVAEGGKSTPFTIGKIEEGLAILVSDDLNLVEFPIDCLPQTSGPIGIGSIINLCIDHNRNEEHNRLESFFQLQNSIIEKYGEAKKPSERVIETCLKPGICSHSSVMACWPSWKSLAEKHGWSADLISLDCYLGGKLFYSSIHHSLTIFRFTPYRV